MSKEIRLILKIVVGMILLSAIIIGLQRCGEKSLQERLDATHEDWK